jgi:DNA-binding MarR family transcriptional regulator
MHGAAPSRPELWTTANPLRFRLLELLRGGPATASQLARRLGESSGTTSYHLRRLAAAGVIEEDSSLGTRRERWWRRTPEDGSLAPTDADPEGREITKRFFTMFFERDAEARGRFLNGEVDDEWHRAAFAGNWIVELTPEQAAALGERLFVLVDEVRGRNGTGGDGGQALVSISILPWSSK